MEIFLWIGQRSYAIYLIHIPVYFTLRELGFRFGWKFGAYPVLSFASAFFLILLLAEINYRFLERPLRQKGREISGRIYPQPAKVLE